MRDLGSSTIQAKASSSSVISLSWKVYSEIEENFSGFYGYQVQYKLSDDSQFMAAVNVSHFYNVNVYSADVTGLRHNTGYTVRVAMYRQHDALFELSPHRSQDINTSTLCTGN